MLKEFQHPVFCSKCHHPVNMDNCETLNGASSPTPPAVDFTVPYSRNRGIAIHNNSCFRSWRLTWLSMLVFPNYSDFCFNLVPRYASRDTCILATFIPLEIIALPRFALAILIESIRKKLREVIAKILMQ